MLIVYLNIGTYTIFCEGGREHLLRGAGGRVRLHTAAGQDHRLPRQVLLHHGQGHRGRHEQPGPAGRKPVQIGGRAPGAGPQDWLRLHPVPDPLLPGILTYLLGYSVADPGSGAFLIPCIRDPGWVKNQDPDPRSESWMSNPDRNS